MLRSARPCANKAAWGVMSTLLIERLVEVAGNPGPSADHVFAILMGRHAAQIKGLHQTGDFFWGGAQIKVGSLFNYLFIYDFFWYLKIQSHSSGSFLYGWL